MLSELEAGLGYTFRDKSILENALTHSSYANENRERGLHDNERLEFLGDSILGYKSHMGAGSITSNVKSDKLPVVVRCGQERMDTGRKKVGAMLGDFVEVGCNSVLKPRHRYRAPQHHLSHLLRPRCAGRKQHSQKRRHGYYTEVSIPPGINPSSTRFISHP